MSVRRAELGDDNFSDRPSHQVKSPETFLTWHDYAFSEAPELHDDELVTRPEAS